MNQWPIAVQLAFPVLQGAEDKFIDKRTGGEVDLSGTARGAFSLEEEGRLGDQFLSNLRRFATGDIPPADTVLEKQVNDLYQRALVLPVSGTVTAEGVRRTQIAWIALRDQWMAFAQIAWPNATAARIVSELQRQRIQELEALDARR